MSTQPATPDAAVKLGLWGGVAGGKTTFLAALRAAMLRNPEGGNTIVGQRHDIDNRFLVDQLNALMDGEFPPATTDKSDYRFHVELASPATASNRRLDSGRRSFDLEIHDYPGGAFRDGAGHDQFEQLSTFLSTCRGFIYLYDPTAQRNSNFRHFDETLLRLSQRQRTSSGAGKNQVHQYMAVCITKYDDADVLARLQERHLIAIDTVNGITTPTVSSAKEAFTLLASENDPGLAPTIRDYFMDGRVEYFAVSSVGFYTRPAQKVRLEDCCNVVVTADGARIRGQFQPVNVLAPLIWLQQKAVS